jgi:hypothetical protein
MQVRAPGVRDVQARLKNMITLWRLLCLLNFTSRSQFKA